MSTQEIQDILKRLDQLEKKKPDGIKIGRTDVEEGNELEEER